MAHAMQQPKFTSPIKFKTFSKYDFVESFVSATKDEKIKPEEKIKAAIIADAIEETQGVLLENLATKEDLKILEMSMKKEIQSLLIKLAFGAITLVIIPIVVAVAIAYTKHLFG